MIIKGKIVSIGFQKNGFVAFNMRPDDIKGLPVGAMNELMTYMSCKGSYPVELSPGTSVEVSGSFSENKFVSTNIYARRSIPKLQFSFKTIDVLSSLESEDGLKQFFIQEIPHCGAKFTDMLFKAFPEDEIKQVLSLDRDKSIEKLKNVKGVGAKKAEDIYDSWVSLATKRDTLTELFNYGLSSAYAIRVYDTFGVDSIRKIEENPYVLTQVKGIGFKKAEDIATSHFDIPKDSLARYSALVEHFMFELCEADTLFSLNDLKSRVKDYLLNDDFQYSEKPDEIVMRGLNDNIEKGRVKEINKEIFMLSRFYDIEKKIAQKLLAMKEEKNELRVKVNSLKDYDYLTEEQQSAVVNSLTNKLSILNGPAGSGKTTATKVIINGIVKSGYTYAIISPTNKAVKRIKEVNSFKNDKGEIETIEAYTIHSLLGLRKGSNTPKFYDLNPLPYDYIIIDESSMMGERNASMILNALSSRSSIVFIGDKNQLSSVDYGSFFNDICESGAFKENTTSLSVVKRTENIINEIVDSVGGNDSELKKGPEGTGTSEIEKDVNNIVANSQRILSGKAPISTKSNTFCKYYSDDEFSGKELGKPYSQFLRDDIILSLKKLYDKLIDSGIDYNKDYQILIPVYKGDIGIDNLNKIFSEYLNGANEEIDIDGFIFRKGDKIYYDDKNDDHGLVKGDTGKIENIDPNEKEMSIYFYASEKTVTLPFSDVKNVKLGYAMSIHKSQGSEFDYASVVLTSQAYALLNNNIFYTGYTRGKKKVFLFAEKVAATIALNNKESARNTYLFNILANINDDDIEIVKSRELKGVSENQVKFAEKKLSEYFGKEGRIVRIKPTTSALVGFKYVFASKEFLSDNGFFEKVEIDDTTYSKFRYSKEISFIRISVDGNEINGFYKSKISNNFNHMVLSIDKENKVKIFSKKNSIINVF